MIVIGGGQGCTIGVVLGADRDTIQIVVLRVGGLIRGIRCKAGVIY
ncbi:MAG: hypothetical protein HY253_04475 [Burkholderiales bacterium]|nr:hypothetical protein [Burkholderiales bacterium]